MTVATREFVHFFAIYGGQNTPNLDRTIEALFTHHPQSRTVRSDGVQLNKYEKRSDFKTINNENPEAIVAAIYWGCDVYLIVQ